MSVEVQAKVACDGPNCLAAIRATDWRATMAKDCMRRAKRALVSEKWLTINRGRFHTELHYCPLCADGVPIELNPPTP